LIARGLTVLSALSGRAVRRRRSAAAADHNSSARRRRRRPNVGVAPAPFS